MVTAARYGPVEVGVMEPGTKKPIATAMLVSTTPVTSPGSLSPGGRTRESEEEVDALAQLAAHNQRHALAAKPPPPPREPPPSGTIDSGLPSSSENGVHPRHKQGINAAVHGPNNFSNIGEQSTANHNASVDLQATAEQPEVMGLTEEQRLERIRFYHQLHNFMSDIKQPIQRLPTLGFKELDLWVLYREVTARRGIDAVIAKKQWKEIADALHLPASCTDSGFRLRLHYVRYLEPYERAHFIPPPELPTGLDSSNYAPSTVPAPVVTSRPVGLPPPTQSDSPPVHAPIPTAPGPLEYQPSIQKRVSAPTPPPLDEAPPGTYNPTRPLVKPEQNTNTKRCLSRAKDSATKRHPSKAARPNRPATNQDRPTVVDFSKLDMPALRRYRRHFLIKDLGTNPTKKELVASVSRHFANFDQPVLDEQETIREFLAVLRRSRAL